MPRVNTPLLVGSLTAIVTILGWIVAYFTTRWREDRTRRLEAALKHHMAQIEQFYGPLFNLAHQIFIAIEVQDELLEISSLSYEDRETITDYFQTTYFKPLHRDINDIFKNRLHLVDGIEMPESFYLYLRHAAQENIQRTLWSDYRIDTLSVQGVPFPEHFFDDVTSALTAVHAAYEAEVRLLRTASKRPWYERLTSTLRNRYRDRQEMEEQRRYELRRHS